jgi:hypothetical protein
MLLSHTWPGLAESLVQSCSSTLFPTVVTHTAVEMGSWVVGRRGPTGISLGWQEKNARHQCCCQGAMGI